jgi:hypothetical protein
MSLQCHACYPPNRVKTNAKILIAGGELSKNYRFPRFELVMFSDNDERLF